MTTEALREFVMVAEMGSYIRAAEPLFISETTLSRHIIALEKELGVSLLRRLARHVELTNEGAIFINYARQIISEEDACQLAVAKKLNFSRNTLSIGIDSAMAFYGVAELISGFRARYPEFILQLTEDDSFSLNEQVADGQLQLAFVLDAKLTRNTALKYKAYQEDILVAAVPERHMLVSRKSVHLSMLKQEPLLFPPPFTAMHELCVRAFRNVGLTPKPEATACLTGKTAVDLVRNGLCVAVLPRRIAETWVGDGIAVCELFPRPEIQSSLIYTTDTLFKAGRLFTEYVFGGNCS